jgi:hypothetical protein
VNIRAVIVDADNTKSVQSEDPALYNEIIQNFPLSGTALSELNVPAYIGGGPYLQFVPTSEGQICCPTVSWKQTFFPSGNNDGNFNNFYYFDMPGTIPKTYPGNAENQYHLELQCHRGGYTFTVWDIIWSYRAHWQAGTPSYEVEVWLPW